MAQPGFIQIVRKIALKIALKIVRKIVRTAGVICILLFPAFSKAVQYCPLCNHICTEDYCTIHTNISCIERSENSDSHRLSLPKQRIPALLALGDAITINAQTFTTMLKETFCGQPQNYGIHPPSYLSSLNIDLASSESLESLTSIWPGAHSLSKELIQTNLENHVFFFGVFIGQKKIEVKNRCHHTFIIHVDRNLHSTFLVWLDGHQTPIAALYTSRNLIILLTELLHSLEIIELHIFDTYSSDTSNV